MKQIIIEKCGDCPLVERFLKYKDASTDWVETAYKCMNMEKLVNKEKIDQDCPLPDKQETPDSDSHKEENDENINN